MCGVMVDHQPDVHHETEVSGQEGVSKLLTGNCPLWNVNILKCFTLPLWP